MPRPGVLSALSTSFFILRATEAIRAASQRLLKLPCEEWASGEPGAGGCHGHQGEACGRARQEAAGFSAVWSKINLAWVDLQWGARVQPKSRDPDFLACRTGQ